MGLKSKPRPIMYEREEYDIIFNIDNMLMRMNLPTLTYEEERIIQEIDKTKNIDVDKLWIEMQMAPPESMSELLQGDIKGTNKLQGDIDHGKILAISLKFPLPSRETHMDILLSRMK